MFRPTFETLFLAVGIIVFSVTVSTGQVSPLQRGCIMGNIEACRTACEEGDDASCSRAKMPVPEKPMRNGYVIPNLADLDNFSPKPTKSSDVRSKMLGECTQKRNTAKCVAACEAGGFNGCAHAGRQIANSDPQSALYFHALACLYGERRAAKYSCAEADKLNFDNKISQRFSVGHFASVLKSRFPGAPKPKHPVVAAESSKQAADKTNRSNSSNGKYRGQNDKPRSSNKTLADNIKSALNRNVIDKLAALDRRAAACRKNGGNNVLAAIDCIQTLGGNINSRMLRMRVEKVVLDQCTIVADYQFLCRYRGIVKAGDSAGPLMKLFELTSKVGGFKYGVFDRDDLGWHLVEYYDTCVHNKAKGVHNCRRKIR